MGWTDGASGVEWRVRLSDAARFRVVAEYATTAGTKGDSFAIMFGDHVVSGRVQPTEKETVFRTVDVGEVALDPGEFSISIRPTASVAGELMRLRRLEKVAARFKGKSLRFDERLGAYVIDPRYPEVRQYLIDIYTTAIRDWGIDGFKLDFIERFVGDEKTVLEATGGRDYASVNEAADRLMTDVIAELKKIKPDVIIEFRQPYIGPLIRKYGNMFRASDSPNAYLANRVKTIDLRLLSGNTAVHGDMIMWHAGEPVELAALQYLNILFSVPQVSVRLQEIPKDHLEMVRFYTGYWNSNRAVLLEGGLDAPFPLANYPLVRAHTRDKQIVAVYNDVVVDIDGRRATDRIDIVNAKNSETVVLAVKEDLGSYRYEVRDCRGQLVKSGDLRLAKGLVQLDVPVSGIAMLQRLG